METTNSAVATEDVMIMQYRLRLPHTEYLVGWILLALILYFSAYSSVSDVPPSSVPVHHDDYSLYAAAGEPFQLTWIRPLSYFLMSVLSGAGPEWLAWTVRALAITYVFLCWVLLQQVTEHKLSRLFMVMYGISIYASPMSVENTRYMGVLTQLLSGCLGVLSAVIAIKAVKAGKYDQSRTMEVFWLLFSGLCITASTLAKEGFVLLYAVTIVYAVYRWRPTLRLHLSALSFFSFTSVFLILAAKILADSSFLGVKDESSTYFVNINPISILSTAWIYLTGSGHPAMRSSGICITVLAVFLIFWTIGRSIREKRVHSGFYLLAAAFSVMLPYCLLPNHVYPYYEILWLPFILAALYAILSETKVHEPSNKKLVIFAKPSVVIIAVALLFSLAGYKGRQGIAAWYDRVAEDNLRVFSVIEENRVRIEQAMNVCVEGANIFSPWYLHGGGYMQTVKGIDAKWFVLSNERVPEYAGFKAGSDASRGRVVLVHDFREAPVNCVKINLKPKSGGMS
jgi:hypothetical protein